MCSIAFTAAWWKSQTGETGCTKDGQFENRSDLDVDAETGLFTRNSTFSDFRRSTAGKFIIPGLNDSHLHVSRVGESASLCNLQNCKSISEMKMRLSEYSVGTDRAMIIGINWDQACLGRYPTRYDIDEIVSSVPVFLYRMCFHIGVGNTNLMHRIGILTTIDGHESTSISDVEGGCVDVDENNVVTGILKENATRLVYSFIDRLPTHTKSCQKRFLELGMQICLENGLTSIQTNDKDSIDIFNELNDENKLVLRVFHTPFADDIFAQQPLTDNGLLLPGTQLQSNKRLMRDRLKVFSDGSLGAETALTRRPYKTKKANGDDNYGIGIHSDESMKDIMARAYQCGYRLEIHSIGDGSAQQVLNCLSECPYKARPCLTHCQILGDDLVDQMLGLGVVANVQPSFVATDSNFISDRFHAKDIDDMDYLYAWKSMMRKGVVCCGGSDSPIETCDPFQGMFDAMFRLPRTAQSSLLEAVENQVNLPSEASWEDIVRSVGETWNVFRCESKNQLILLKPNECLTFSESLWLYTQGSAFSCMSECFLGRVEEGYLADCLVLNYDPASYPFLLNRSIRDHLSRKYINFRRFPLIDSVWVGGISMFTSKDGSSMISTPDLCGGGSVAPGKNGIGGLLFGSKCGCCGCR